MTVTEPASLAERASLWLILASQSFNAVAAVAVIPAMPAIAGHFGGHAGDGAFLAQMVLVTPAFSIILGSPLAGTASRLLGWRSVMVAAVLLYAMAGFYGYIATGLAPLLASRLLLGMASSFLAALTTAEASTFSPERQSRLIGLSTAIAAVATILTMVGCGWLTSRFGWHAAFLVYLLPLPLLPVILLATHAAAPAEPTIRRATEFAPFASVVPIYLLAALWSVMVFAPSIEGPFILAARGMDNPSVIGIVIGLTALVAALSSAAYGWVADEFSLNTRKQFIFACFLASASFIIFTRQKLGVEIGIIIGGIPAGVVAPLLISQLLQRLPPYYAATAIGLYMSVAYGSQVADPLLFKMIKAFTPLPVFTVIAIISLLGILLLLIQAKRDYAQHRSRAV